MLTAKNQAELNEEDVDAILRLMSTHRAVMEVQYNAMLLLCNLVYPHYDKKNRRALKSTPIAAMCK